MNYIYYYHSPLGKITLASNGNALIGLWLEGQKYFCNQSGSSSKRKELPIFEQTCKWLDIYFEGKNPDFTPLLSPNGTPFQKMVWEILLKIPYGQTMTYGEIARKIAKQKGIARMSAQAVGGAVGHNPISLIVPCHRVIGANGNLTGYAGGIDKKIYLLNLEKVDLKSVNH